LTPLSDKVILEEMGKSRDEASYPRAFIIIGIGKQLGKPGRLAALALMALSFGMVGVYGSRAFSKKSKASKSQEPPEPDLGSWHFCKKSALGKHLPELKEGTISFSLDGNDFDSDQSSSDAENTIGPDKAHLLVLKKRTRVWLKQRCDGNCALYIIRKCWSKSIGDPWIYSCDPYNKVKSCELNLYRILKPGTYYVISDSFENMDAGNVELTTTFDKAAGSGVDGDSCADAPPLPSLEYVKINTFKAKDDIKSYWPDEMPPVNTSGAADAVRKFVVDEPAYVYMQGITEGEFSAMFFVSSDCSKKSKKILIGLSQWYMEAANSFRLEKGTYYLIVDGSSPNQVGEALVKAQIETVAHFEKACKDAPVLKLGETVKGKTDGWNRFYCADDHTYYDAFYRLEIKETTCVRVTMETSMPCSAISIRNECAWLLIPTKEEIDRTAYVIYGKAEVEATLKPGTYWVVFNSGGPDAEFTISAEACQKKENKKKKNVK